MTPIGWLTFYCVLILLASLVGGWVPLVVRLTHRRMQFAISFVSGVMLGVGVLHLIPHAVHALGAVDRVPAWTLAGILAMFFVQRFFDFHHHDVRDAEDEHLHDHSEQDCAATGLHGHEHPATHRHSWLGAIVGMTLHGLVDGAALAAGVAADARHGSGGMVGVATFLVILLHKPFDSLTLATLMAASGRRLFWRHLVNAAFALTIPFGVGLFYLGTAQLESTATILGCALAFAAGNFICVSLSDLLPEVQFHQHDRLALSAALILGLLVAWAIGLAEGHNHGMRQASRAVVRDLDQSHFANTKEFALSPPSLTGG